MAIKSPLHTDKYLSFAGATFPWKCGSYIQFKPPHFEVQSLAKISSSLQKYMIAPITELRISFCIAQSVYSSEF
jgi:hypothetical protein